MQLRGPRRHTAAAKEDTALRETQSHLDFELDWERWLGPDPGCQHVCASLRRITATDGPTAS
ncbi:hypothetical protein ACFY04_36470 [Streptomyces sp. NPDC001549]|uniref:hypothetical protein n=1 Tax=Streptomyces sp. NPDC001549 TaxID=3364586 RepID=UPI0036A34B2C